jgi:uncharacterized membrane protein
LVIRQLPHQEHALFDTSIDSPHVEGRSQLILVLIAALAGVAVCLSGYLTWITWSDSSAAGCTAVGPIDCDHVLGSKWSKWLGLPISLFGTLTYAGIVAVSWHFARRSQGMGLTGLLALSMLAAGSAMWFVGLQFFALQNICAYCMAVHACGLTIGVLTLLLLRESTPGSNEDQMRILLGVADVATPANPPSAIATLSGFHPLVAAAIAGLGLMVLMAGQFFFSHSDRPTGLMYEPIPPTTTGDVQQAEGTEEHPVPSVNNEENIAETASQEPDENPESDSEAQSETTPTLGNRIAETRQRLMNFRGLPEPIDVFDVPVLGNPEAEHVVVEMLDYTCSHCRHLHKHVHAAVERYGDQVAFVVYHAPLSRRCNPHVKLDRPVHMYACDYARLALGVWKLDQTKFVEFHDWLMESKKPPSVFEARRKAMKLVGQKILLDKALKADLFRGFASNSNVVKEVQAGLPLLLTEGGIIRGFAKDEGEWFKFLEKLLDIEPVK